MTAWAELWPDFAIQRIPCAERASAHGLIARNNQTKRLRQFMHQILRRNRVLILMEYGMINVLRSDKVKAHLEMEDVEV